MEPYKGHEKHAVYARPHLEANGIRCRKYMWLGMAGDIDILKVDGRVREFDIRTHREVT